MAFTLSYSILQYQNDINLMYTGNGVADYFNSNRMQNDGLTSCIANLTNQNKSVPIGCINWFLPLNSVTFPQITGVQTNEGGDYYIFESLSAGLISAENYSKWMNIPDRWFVGNTSSKHAQIIIYCSECSHNPRISGIIIEFKS